MVLPCDHEGGSLDNNRVDLSAGRRQIHGAGSQDTLRDAGWRAWLREEASLQPLSTWLHEAEFRALQHRVPLARSKDRHDLWLEFPLRIRGDLNAKWTRWPGTMRPR